MIGPSTGMMTTYQADRQGLLGRRDTTTDDRGALHPERKEQTLEVGLQSVPQALAVNDDGVLLS